MPTISMLDYVVRNWPTHGDPTLEETRQAALRELDELYGQVRGGHDKTRSHPRSEPQLLVLGHMYRGTIIFTLPSGEFFVLDDRNQKYDFASIPEAEAFIDANLAMSGLLLGALA